MSNKRKGYKILLVVVLVLICVTVAVAAVMYIWGQHKEQEYQKKKEQGIIAARLLKTDMQEVATVIRQEGWIDLGPAKEEYRKTIFILAQQREEEAKRLKEIKGMLPTEPLYVNTTLHLLDAANKLTPALVDK